MKTSHFHTVIVLLALVATSACGANGAGANTADLPPIAAEGRSIALQNGCASCHGTDGEGGIGPAFIGLFGSSVELEDGSTIVADRDYLVEAIKDPAAKKVAGYRLAMPTNNLSDAEIDQVVAYIEALATPDGTNP